MAPRILFVAALSTLSLGAQPSTFASVVPALAYGPVCNSTIHLQNLGDRRVTVELQGHRESGALVPTTGSDHLEPHEQGAYVLNIPEETTAAWAIVREQTPSLAISATTECRIGDELRTTTRTVAYPTRNPWFAGDVAEMPGNLISLINTAGSPVRATACYSSGSLYSVAGEALQPVCSATLDVQIPPYNSRQFPVSRDGSTHFSLKTKGAAIVLEMLRPLSQNVHIYAVDSSIKFGEEAAHP